MSMRLGIKPRLVTALSLVALALAASLAAKPDEAEARKLLEGQVEELQAERVGSTRSAADAMLAAYQAETVDFADLLTAYDARLDAELAVAKNAPQKIAAYTKLLTSVTQTEQRIFNLFNMGQRGGEAEKYYQVVARRQAAEIALIKECLAAGVEYSWKRPPESK